MAQDFAGDGSFVLPNFIQPPRTSATCDAEFGSWVRCVLKWCIVNEGDVKLRITRQSIRKSYSESFREHIVSCIASQARTSGGFFGFPDSCEGLAVLWNRV